MSQPAHQPARQQPIDLPRQPLAGPSATAGAACCRFAGQRLPPAGTRAAGPGPTITWPRLTSIPPACLHNCSLPAWPCAAVAPCRSTWAGRTVIRSCGKLAYPHVQSMIEGQFLGGQGHEWVGGLVS